MSLQHHFNLSLYNKGKQESKLLFESRAKVNSLTKKKSYLSKTLEKFSLVENEKFENLFLLPPTIYDGIATPPSYNFNNQYFQYLEIHPNSSDNDLLNSTKWLNSQRFEKVCINFNLSDYLNSEVTLFCKPINNRVSEIIDELRILKLEVKQSHCTKLFLRIKQLVHELHSLVSFSFCKHKKELKNLEKSLTSFSSIDLRNLFRNRVRCLFKCFNDFSGSEEDSIAQIILSRNNFFKLINRKTCIINMKLQSQLIYT